MTNDPFFDVSQQVVLITGVSGQLGISYAGALLARGARVAGIDIHQSVASENLGRSYPDHFLFLQGNVTHKASLSECLANIEKAFGTPSVLINNAAIDSPPASPLEENGPFEDYPEKSWDRVIDVNLKGVYLCCQVFGAVMAKAGRGSINFKALQRKRGWWKNWRKNINRSSLSRVSRRIRGLSTGNASAK